jgi:hypothetical protein
VAAVGDGKNSDIASTFSARLAINRGSIADVSACDNTRYFLRSQF